MLFDSSISGEENEISFIKFFNKRKVGELSFLCRLFIEDLFGNIDNDKIIYCWKDYYLKKSDICLKIGDVKKFISIKKGIKNSVHVERITDFIDFLKDNKIDSKSIIEYLKYHYADGTTNGSGEHRISSKDYKLMHQEEIDNVNIKINREDLLDKVANRFILKGRTGKDNIDVLIYGVVKDFIWIKSENIKQIIKNKKDIYSSAIHFGPLTCQPQDRCLNRNPKYESKRYCVQIKWYNIFDDYVEFLNSKGGDIY